MFNVDEYQRKLRAGSDDYVAGLLCASKEWGGTAEDKQKIQMIGNEWELRLNQESDTQALAA